MNIQQLKEQIVNNTVGDEMIIFKVTDSNFIANQYTAKIAQIKNKEVEYISEMPKKMRDIFGMEDLSPTLKVFKTDEVLSPKSNKVRDNEENKAKVLDDVHKDLIIITSRIDKEIEEKYSAYITEVPKLENWQVEDYIYTFAEGLSKDNIIKLASICGGNIDRAAQEVKKLFLFEPNERNFMFEKLLSENSFGVEFNNNSIFDFCDAIMKRDYASIANIYKIITTQDIEPLGVVTILYKKFKQLADLQMHPNPTAETCNMSSKQFYYMKNYVAFRYYSNEQIVRNLKILTDLDRKLKCGEFVNAAQTLNDHQYIDYVVTHILCN